MSEEPKSSVQVYLHPKGDGDTFVYDGDPMIGGVHVGPVTVTSKDAARLRRLGQQLVEVADELDLRQINASLEQVSA